MFAVKKVTTLEHYCPNEHQPSDHSIKFCHICGAPIEERQVTYDAAYCANCNKTVHPSWNYCPYCGQARE